MKQFQLVARIYRFFYSRQFPRNAQREPDLDRRSSTIHSKSSDKINMGNTTSESNPLFIAEELDWKTGALADSIPAPIGGLTTYEGLRASTVFKEYLMKHIDSDYLASSVMNMADVEAALLKGIDKYKELEPEWVESLQNLVENFQLCTAAGIDVSKMIFWIYGTIFHLSVQYSNTN